MSVIRFGISLEQALLARFDGLLRKKGYVSRSEAIRDLIRHSLVSDEWESSTIETVGTITVVYSHNTRELADTLTDLQHHHYNSIVSSMHIHIDGHNCLEVIVVAGASARGRWTRTDSRRIVEQFSLTESAETAGGTDPLLSLFSVRNSRQVATPH